MGGVRKMMRKPQPFIRLKDGDIAIDYLTTYQYGGRTHNAIVRVAFFSMRLPGAGKCAHFVINLSADADKMADPELAEWLFANIASAQHIRTCDVLKDSP